MTFNKPHHYDQAMSCRFANIEASREFRHPYQEWQPSDLFELIVAIIE